MSAARLAVSSYWKLTLLSLLLGPLLLIAEVVVEGQLGGVLGGVTETPQGDYLPWIGPALAGIIVGYLARKHQRLVALGFGIGTFIWPLILLFGLYLSVALTCDTCFS